MSEVEAAAAQENTLKARDAALAARLRQRWPEACARLYDRFAPGIHRFAFTRLGDAESAEDVVVETMVDAARDIRRFNPRTSTLASWLYGIARRRVLLEIRRRRRRKSVPARAQVGMESVAERSDGDDLAAAAVARMAAREKVAALRRLLSDREMEVLMLSCIEELSVREIGQVIGRSERAVHSILHRARTKARERLVRDDG